MTGRTLRDGLSQAEPEDVSALRASIPCAERIAAAAICYGGIVASVPRPGRHHDVIREWHAFTGQVTGGKCEQGFITSEGRFVGRKEALRIADRAAQIVEKMGDPWQLFSEDMW